MLGLCFFVVQAQAYQVTTETFLNVPFPKYLESMSKNTAGTNAVHLTAEGCNSEGKVNAYTVACGYFGFRLANDRAGEAKYIVNKFICVNNEVCMQLRYEYLLNSYEQTTVDRHRVDWTVKANKPGNYEVEAYLIIDGAEKKSATGLGNMHIYL